MTSWTCPNGHQSATSDYCDQCGAKIEGEAPAPAVAAPVAPPAAPTPAPTAAPESVPVPVAATAPPTCPVCATPRTGDDRFCEGCGYDFEQVGGAVVPTVDPGEAAQWDVVASADRDYFEHMAPDGVTFPPHCPDRAFSVAGAQVRIGRRSSSRGIAPEIDLSGAPEDPAISHLHAMLLRQDDGSYVLVDPGSTNGTTLNDDLTPIAVNVPVPVADGDRIHVGAWTTLTLRAR